MSTRLNSLLCFMLLLLSVTVLGPEVLHNRDHVAATVKAAGGDLTAFSRQFFGLEAAQDDAQPMDFNARFSRDMTQAGHFLGDLAGLTERAMTDDSREIAHMLTARAELVRNRAADGVATDKKAMDKNLAWLAEAFPETAADARHMLAHSTDFAALMGVFVSQPAAVAAKDAPVDTVETAADSDDAAPTRPVKPAAPARLLKGRFAAMFRAAAAE